MMVVVLMRAIVIMFAGRHTCHHGGDYGEDYINHVISSSPLLPPHPPLPPPPPPSSSSVIDHGVTQNPYERRFSPYEFNGG